MGVSREDLATETFEDFLVRVESSLRLALIATYGREDGRVAACDALSWAWENWADVQAMSNPVGYLYRVGQTAARRHRSRPIPVAADHFHDAGLAEVSPELVPALSRLSAQQRTTVLLVHGLGWTVRDVARTLDLAPSTVQTHLTRGLDRLRGLMEDHDER